MSAQWNGALTGQRHDALRAERLRAFARPRHRGARAGNHDLSGAIHIRRADDLALRRVGACQGHLRLRPAREWPPSRQPRPARLPACSGPVGGRGGARPANENVPAATLAEYSPRLCPATKAGVSPRDASSRHAAVLTARMAGWVFSVSVSSAVRTLEAQTAQRFAQRRVSLGERLSADRERVGQGLAHADGLRALARKDEGNHW